jgi:hypothetical protein
MVQIQDIVDGQVDHYKAEDHRRDDQIQGLDHKVWGPGLRV